MTKKIIYAVTSISVLLISGCTTVPSAGSGIWITGMPESLTRYYIPATKWQKNPNPSVTSRLDMTYIDEPERPVVCNVSFFNRNTVPKQVTSLYFEADGRVYPLNDVKVMFTRTEYNELRVTSTIEINELLNFLQSGKIYLKAVIDSVEYTFEPDREFLQYRRQFLELAEGGTWF
jgi:hypothetical protein